MDTKPQLIDLLNAIHQETLTFVATLSDAERAAIGEPDHWEAKDLVGHIATWKDRMIDTLEAIARGEAPPSYGDFDHANALIFKSHRDQPWDMICTLLDTAHTRVIRYLEATSEETLSDPEKDPRRSGRSLWLWIFDISTFHPLEHLGGYRIERGQPDYAVQLWEKYLPMIIGLKDTPRWRGLGLYMLASICAQAGQPDKAITTLREAFQTRPDLLERAKQDTALNSIRENPGYQALFATVQGGISMGIKEKLIELVHAAYQEEITFLSRLPEAERAAAGTAQAWSAKDLIGHCITWQERMVNNFHTAARGDPLPAYGEIDEANAQIFAENAGKSWDDMCQMIEGTHARLADYIQAANEVDLTDPERSVLKNNRPLWQNIVGNAVTHSMLHLGQYYADHGQAAYATPMYERFSRQLITLDDSAKWRANTTYNLACYYALAGEKAQAITNLREALTLNPDLTEWSTQDSDLASIREEAGYKALYA